MRWLSGAIAMLGHVNSAVVFGATRISLTLVALMTLIVLAQVFFRYVVGDALTWSEEVARMMMIWMAFLIAPIAYRQGHNVSIELLAQLMKGRLRGLVELGINLLVIGFVVVFFTESLGLVERGQSLKASTVEMQMFWIYLILPVSMSLMFLVGLEKLLKDIRVLIDPSYADTIAPPPITGEAEYE